MNKNKIRWGLS